MCPSVVTETNPGVFSTPFNMAAAAVSSAIPIRASLTALDLDSDITSGLYITGWLGDFPNSGSATYWSISRHQASLSDGFSLSQYDAMVLSLAKATSPNPSDRHFTAPEYP